MVLRNATEDDADLLTALALRSKASWGYDAGFMKRVLPDMQVTAERIRQSHVVIAEECGAPAAFAILRLSGEGAILHDLFVAPEYLRRGIGRRLFDDAVTFARDNGAARLMLVSDPNAEAFYEKLGMHRIGCEASIAGRNRLLPVMGMEL